MASFWGNFSPLADYPGPTLWDPTRDDDRPDWLTDEQADFYEWLDAVVAQGEPSECAA